MVRAHARNRPNFDTSAGGVRGWATEQMDTDVLIVGAGPTGSTLAAVLAARNVSFEIVDAAPGPERESSRATSVHAATLELLDRLDGLGRRLADLGMKARRSSMWSGARRLGHIDWEKMPTPYAHLLNLPQTVTERELRARFERDGRRVRWGVTVTGARSSDDGVRVSAETEQGDRVFEARYAVGCDGAHSAIRHSLDVPLDGKTYPERFLLADVDLESGTPHLSREETHVFVSTQGVLGIMPMPGGSFRLNGTLSEDEIADDENLARICAARTGDARQRIQAVHWASDYRTHRRIVRKMHEGRLFLAGDAAHLNSPVGGQGMNLGIQDAFNLGWKLAYVLERIAPEALLDTYHSERHPTAKRALEMTERSTKMLAARRPLERWIRNRFVSFAHRLPPFQRQLTWEPAGLLHRYPARHGRKGIARLPNVDLGGDWLHRRFHGITHHLLLLGAASPRTTASLPLSTVNVESIPPGLGIEAPKAVLVRPDGFIAWQGPPDEKTIEGALDTITRTGRA